MYSYLLNDGNKASTIHVNINKAFFCDDMFKHISYFVFYWIQGIWSYAEVLDSIRVEFSQGDR